MGTSYISEGNVLRFTAPAGGVTKGVPVLIGGLCVIPAETAAQTVAFDGYVTGVHSAPKADSQAWTEGAVVYLDNTAHVFTTVSTANYRAGIAVEAVAGTGGLTTGKVRLNGVGVTAVGGAAP
jgi:predicted RecA/RadA family phage recombinase